MARLGYKIALAFADYRLILLTYQLCDAVIQNCQCVSSSSVDFTGDRIHLPQS